MNLTTDAMLALLRTVAAERVTSTSKCISGPISFSSSKGVT